MGKGGSTQSVQVPQWLEDAARRNLGIADQVARVGPVPLSYGPTVADFTDAQRAAFNNTNAMAAAYGMNAPGQYNVGSPVTYPNGVRALSAAPLFEAQMAAFRDARPGQANYIDGFFIDPITGAPAGNVAVQYGSGSFGNPGGVGGAQNASADGGNDGARFAPAPTPATTLGAAAEGTFGSGGNYNELFQRDYNEASADADANPYGMTTGTPIYDQGYVGISDNFGTKVKGAINNSLIGGVGTAITGEPMFADVNSLLPPDPNAPASEDLPGNAVSRALNIGAGKKDPDSDSGYAGEPDDGCVIATHAVAAGAYNHQTKRQAVVWCMNALHGKWWGEAVRRGYRHLGRRKIAQGKAAEHYDEFRRYIDFASGKNRTLRGAITFTLRTAQFFVVGMMNQEL